MFLLFNIILIYSSRSTAPHVLFNVLSIVFILLFISSDVIVVPSFNILIFKVIDFLFSGTWFPRYSSTNSTSLTLLLKTSLICDHLISSSTNIDKSFSTSGSSGNLSYTFVL